MVRYINNDKLLEIERTSKKDRILECFGIYKNFTMDAATEIGKIVHIADEHYTMIIDEKNNCNLLLSEDRKRLIKVEAIDNAKPVRMVVPMPVEVIKDYAATKPRACKDLVEDCKDIVSVNLVHIALPKKGLKTIEPKAFTENTLDDYISVNSVDVVRECLQEESVQVK